MPDRERWRSLRLCEGIFGGLGHPSPSNLGFATTAMGSSGCCPMDCQRSRIVQSCASGRGAARSMTSFRSRYDSLLKPKNLPCDHSCSSQSCIASKWMVFFLLVLRASPRQSGRQEWGGRPRALRLSFSGKAWQAQLCSAWLCPCSHSLCQTGEECLALVHHEAAIKCHIMSCMTIEGEASHDA